MVVQDTNLVLLDWLKLSVISDTRPSCTVSPGLRAILNEGSSDRLLSGTLEVSELTELPLISDPDTEIIEERRFLLSFSQLQFSHLQALQSLSLFYCWMQNLPLISY